jgi:hypothetical protein
MVKFSTLPGVVNTRLVGGKAAGVLIVAGVERAGVPAAGKHAGRLRIIREMTIDQSLLDIWLIGRFCENRRIFNAENILLRFSYSMYLVSLAGGVGLA